MQLQLALLDVSFNIGTIAEMKECHYKELKQRTHSYRFAVLR